MTTEKEKRFTHWVDKSFHTRQWAMGSEPFGDGIPGLTELTNPLKRVGHERPVVLLPALDPGLRTLGYQVLERAVSVLVDEGACPSSSGRDELVACGGVDRVEPGGSPAGEGKW